MGFVQRGLDSIGIALSADVDRWYNAQNVWLMVGLLGAVFYWFTRGY